jgi:mersacidin/lichenicidin family type 2 lantibiotic
MQGGNEMKTNHIVRAWKDEDYRSSLSQSERSLVPQHPAGAVELSDSDLRRVTGGQDADTCICGTRIIDSCVKPPVQCP